MLVRDFIKDKGAEAIRIGMWFTSCCERDLKRIETQEEINEIIENYEEADLSEIWDMEMEALLSIKQGHGEITDPKEIEYWDRLIKDAQTRVV